MEFSVKQFLDFCLHFSTQNILHPEQMLLIPHGIFHSRVLTFDIGHIVDV